MTKQNRIVKDSVLGSTRLYFNDENRVRTRAEFLRVYRTCPPIKRRGVVVFVEKTDTPDTPTRLGITVTKKTIGKANKRNQLRRRVREIFRNALPALRPGHIVIVNLTNAALTMNYHQLRKSLFDAWTESGLFSAQPPTEDANTPAKTPAPDDAPSTCAKVMAVIESPFRLTMLGFIKLYRMTISPIMPPICRFYPSCSAYGLECLQTLPFHKALPLIIWRIIRCNPLCKGGYDPVPNGRHPMPDTKK